MFSGGVWVEGNMDLEKMVEKSGYGVGFLVKFGKFFLFFFRGGFRIVCFVLVDVSVLELYVLF